MNPSVPLPMHRLATLLACDNSNVTGLVDRLEARGLVAREPYHRDRRVKHIVLTPLGEQLQAQMTHRIARPPDGFDNLTLGEQRQLRDLLKRALESKA
jgi:DNA-binding MarR family transcriptional regulator